MIYEPEKKYLVLPVSSHAKMKNLCFYDPDGKCVYDLDLRLDPEAWDREVYIDMHRFVGKKLEVSVKPEVKLEMRQKDRKPLERFKEKLRPKYHFTAPEGWMNDPNGMVYADGVYHFFYQLNPCDTGWGNMHWGHAVSRNLVDWEHMPIALFPDKMGAMFSGGGIVDSRNLLGNKYCEKTPIVLFYTAAGSKSTASKGQPFTQCMAISSDGGETFGKYPGNPVIPHIVESNRDPKVVWSDTLGLYVMSLYLLDDKYAIFTSKNLKSWDKVCEHSIPDDNECPAFFPMKNSSGEEKWILMGARDKYIVGSFDGKEFIPEHEGTRTVTYMLSDGSYAAQKFENTGERNIRMVWLRTDFAPHGMKFNSAMSFPQEMELISTEAGDVLRFSPVLEIKKLHSKKVKENRVCKELSVPLTGIAQDLTIDIDSRDAKKAVISLFGTDFEIDFEARSFSCKRGTLFYPVCADGKFSVRLLCDTCGTEIYLADGRSYGVCTEIPDASLSTLKISSDSDIKIKLEAYRLRTSGKSDRRK